MRIEEFIRLVLASMPSDGWSQMSRQKIIELATRHGVVDPILCADACNTIGIGELTEGEQPGRVVFSFERPSA